MPKPFPHAYTHSHRVSSEGEVSFACSQDAEIWPWLALGPIHPILVQTINFWGSVESGEVLGTFDPDKWSALTQVEWTCGAPDVGLPVRGTYAAMNEDDQKRYQLRFYDAGDQEVVHLSGRGVVFRTRNFEGWRKETKAAFRRRDNQALGYASADALGVGSEKERFLAPLRRDAGIRTTGLITKENGLRPAHPYIGGSGDHVNSTHMGEVGRQFAELLLGSPLINRSGEMKFMHYVELGRPFEVEMIAHDETTQILSMTVRQRDRDCARIEFAYHYRDQETSS